MKKLLSVFFMFMVFSQQSLSNEEEGSVSNVGEDKGVTEATVAKGFKLTPEAVKHLGIKTTESKKEGKSITLPKSALASAKRERFVYTLNDGFYKAVEVNVLDSNSTQVTVAPEHEPISGQIVVEGVHFLKNIEADIFSGDEGGHHH